MKNIIFKTMAAMLALFLVVGCDTEAVDPNNPDRPRIPTRPEITMQGNPELEQTITLTATADYAESFEWRRDGQALFNITPMGDTIWETGRTLQVEALGFFPDTANITVAGVNVSGTGAFSLNRAIPFLPWEAPGPPEIAWNENINFFYDDSLRNESPNLFVDLIARIWQAYEFEWFLNGELIEGATGPTLRIQGDTVGDLILRSGTYTVRGSNMWGDGEMSEPMNVAWTEVVMSLAGTWNVTGTTTGGGNVSFTTIIHSRGDGSYIARQWSYGVWEALPAEYGGVWPEIVFQGTAEGVFTFNRGPLVSHPGTNFEQASFQRPLAGGGFGFGPAALAIAIAADGNTFNIQASNATHDLFVGIFQPPGTLSLSLTNLVFTRATGGSSAPASAAPQTVASGVNSTIEK